MFKHRFDETPSNVVVLHWFMLSFNGGCINAGGFMATGRFVSHVTGFATLFGVSLARGTGEALSLLSVPLFFLAGAFIAGLLIDRPLRKGLRPHFDWVMGLSSACLFAAAFAFHAGGVLGFGENYLLMVLLCLASGLQNAAITSSSGSTVRTTHMTGLTTDLGLGLARALDVREGRANALRIGSIVSFVLGSAAGAFLFSRYGFHGFTLPAAIAAYAAWHGRRALTQSPHRDV